MCDGLGIDCPSSDPDRLVSALDQMRPYAPILFGNDRESFGALVASSPSCSEDLILSQKVKTVLWRGEPYDVMIDILSRKSMESYIIPEDVDLDLHVCQLERYVQRTGSYFGYESPKVTAGRYMRRLYDPELVNSGLSGREAFCGFLSRWATGVKFLTQDALLGRMRYENIGFFYLEEPFPAVAASPMMVRSSTEELEEECGWLQSCPARENMIAGGFGFLEQDLLSVLLDVRSGRRLALAG